MLGMFVPFSLGSHSILVKQISFLYPPGRSSFTLRKSVQRSTRKHLHAQLIPNPCFLFPVQLPLGFLTIAGQCDVSGVPKSWLPVTSSHTARALEEGLRRIYPSGSAGRDSHGTGHGVLTWSESPKILSRMSQGAIFLGNCPRAVLRVTKRISEGMEKLRLRVLVHAKLTTV